MPVLPPLINVSYRRQTFSTGTDCLFEMSDGDLLSVLREGRMDAYGVLFQRHHKVAHLIATRQTRDHHLAKDVVLEAFTSILAAIQSGSGPVGTFHGYLRASVTHEACRALRRRAREVLVPDHAEEAMVYLDQADILVSNGLRAAYLSLPERWRRVLWHMEVLEMPARDVAPVFGLSSNAVIALHRRAKHGLRQAYLQQQGSDSNV